MLGTLAAVAVVRRVPIRKVTLDGEVLGADPEGYADFRSLCRGEGALHYAAFDLLWLNGRDLRTKPLTERKRGLERLIRTTTPLLSRVLTVPTDGLALFEAAQRLDLEGIVAKRKADPYSLAVTWYKIKNRAYTQMEGRWELFQKQQEDPRSPSAARVQSRCPPTCRGDPGSGTRTGTRCTSGGAARWYPP
jgi:ATP-dependent DNA ligase